MQKIIIIGKPNVGKSSLFNCFLKERVAITSEIVGTTRDVNIKPVKINALNAVLCDTAGLVKKGDEIFNNEILRQISADDIILYVIDGGESVDERDVELFHNLVNLKNKKTPKNRAKSKDSAKDSIKDSAKDSAQNNAILVVNKIDKNNNESWEYAIFGTKDIFFTSALHNRGLSKLKNHIEILLHNNIAQDDLDFLDSRDFIESKNPADSIDSAESNIINVGIIGRVNVGKSSILNALLDKERSIVSTIEGTTIDPVDEKLDFKGRILNFVDTAGIRQHSRIEGIEKYAFSRTKQILEKSDIVLLILDASKPFVDLDEKISGLSDTHKLGIIIVLNKWDIKCADFDFIKSEIKRKFAYLSYAPIITASALEKRHIEKIKDAICEVYENYKRRIPTALLNETINKAVINHPLPSDKGKLVKIYYATQVESAPPQIVLIMNRPKSLHFSYKRYLINWLRRHFDFVGVPIIILARGKNSNKNLQNNAES